MWHVLIGFIVLPFFRVSFVSRAYITCHSKGPCRHLRARRYHAFPDVLWSASYSTNRVGRTLTTSRPDDIGCHPKVQLCRHSQERRTLSHKPITVCARSLPWFSGFWQLMHFTKSNSVVPPMVVLLCKVGSRFELCIANIYTLPVSIQL